MDGDRFADANLSFSIVAKRKTLFDDRPIEISELTYIIRQDIASLNTQIASLQSYVRSQKPPSASASGSGGKGQVEEHNSNVVMMLQSRLADMGMGFKDVLELRTQVRSNHIALRRARSSDDDRWLTGSPWQNMKASKDRSEQFMHTASNSAVPQPAGSAYPVLPCV